MQGMTFFAILNSVLNIISMAINKRIQTISFFVLLLVFIVLVCLIFKPFANIIMLGLILAISVSPVYKRILSKVNSPNIASILTVILMLLVIALPIWFFGQVIFNEVVNLYNGYRSGAFVINQNQIIANLPSQVQTIIQSISQDINSFIGKLSSEAFASVTGILSNVASFIISFFLLFFIVFFLLRDGEKIKKALIDISPISTTHEDKLFVRIIDAVNGVIKGSFFMAVIQGIVATIGFFIFGVSEPFLWGAFTVLAALVPTVGTSIAIIPAVIYLLVTGQTPQAIGLAIWGACAVGLIDNFIGPRILGSAVQLHPILIMLSIFGGIEFFGVLGFLIGPIIMAIFIALIDIYRSDFKEYLNN